jgi:hypothetical protein
VGKPLLSRGAKLFSLLIPVLFDGGLFGVDPDPLELVRRNLVPVLIGLGVITAVTLFFI